MPENKIAAALLTIALNSTKPKVDPKQMGANDYKLIVEEYQKILYALDQQK
jgi:hypothetical protein